MRLYYRIKNFFVYGWDKFRRRCQRFKRGYAYSDVWNMNTWFMDTVKPMLIHLRDYGIGMPMELCGDFEHDRDAWEAVLTEMAVCLTLMDDDEARKHLGIADDDHSFKSFQKIYELTEQNKNKFFELFSKYFWDLWD